jgi:diguanylate cyclase (GGDEF)-like protein
MQMHDDVLSVSVFEAALRLHESLDASNVVARSVSLLSDMIEADSWAFFLKSDQLDRLELVRVVNASAHETPPFVSCGDSDSVVMQAINRQGPVCIQSNGSQSGKTASFLCVPLVAGHRLIGAIHAARVEGVKSGLEFNYSEVKLASLLSNAIARAMANAIDYHNATRQTWVDDLTRLYNVRYLYQLLDNEIKRSARYGSPLSVVFMDLDGFKMVNDVYGHCAGSVTLAEVAQVVLKSVREVDYVARYGGDEFVIVLPETSARSALEVTERVRTQLANNRFDGGIGATIHLTASFGVASFPDHASEAERLIELADAAMYEAKQRQKNTVRVAIS